MKKSVILLFAVCALSIFAIGATTLFQSSKKSEREYRLKYSDSLFYFQDGDKNKVHAKINDCINQLKKSLANDFLGDLKSFFEDDFDIPVHKNELSLSSEIIENSDKLFSIRIDIYQYFHGSNGCQSKVDTLNFYLSEGSAKQLFLNDIIRPEYKIELLRIAISKLRNRLGEMFHFSLISGLEEFEKTNSEIKPLSEVIRFNISKNGMTVIFPAYTISCGSDGILCANISYEELAFILTPFGKTLFQ